MADIIFFEQFNKSKQQQSPCKVKLTQYDYQPEQQGSLDSLCGIYCIVNAVSKVARLSSQQRNLLFYKLVETLDKKISKYLLDGTTPKQLLYMLKVTQRWLADNYKINISFSPLFKSGLELDLETYLRNVGIFLSYDDSAVIAEITGIHHHWTCFSSIKNKTIQLMDSDGLSLLRTNTCRISKRSQKKYHCLHPSRTWAVILNN